MRIFFSECNENKSFVLPIPFILLDALKICEECGGRLLLLLAVLPRDGTTRLIGCVASRLLAPLLEPVKILELERLNFRVRLVMVRSRELDNTESPPP